MRVSFSMLDTYMSCPLKAKFRYQDQLPQKQNARASFGTCVHAAIEHYNNTGNAVEAEMLFKDYWQNPEKLGVEPEIWPRGANFGSLMQAGLDCIREHHARTKWETRDVLATEHKFLVPIGDHTLSGVVDLLELKTSKTGAATIRLVDYKTNARSPYQSNLRLNVQFTAYVYASNQPEFWSGNGPKYPGLPSGDYLYDLYRNYPRRSIWYGLMQAKEFDAGERNDVDFLRMYRAIEEVAKAVAADIYVPNISGDSCTWCDYTEPCGLPINPRDYNAQTEF